MIFCSEYFSSKKIQVYDYVNELYYSEFINIEADIDEVNQDEQNNDAETS